jgi:hypothetical protein
MNVDLNYELKKIEEFKNSASHINYWRNCMSARAYVDTLLGELDVLHTEYMKYLEERQDMLKINVTAIGVFLGILFAVWPTSILAEPSINPFVAIILTYVSGILGALYLYSSDHMFRLKKYIRDDLRPRFVRCLGDAHSDVMSWWSKGSPSFAPMFLRKYQRVAALFGTLFHPAFWVFLFPSFFGLAFSWNSAMRPVLNIPLNKENVVRILLCLAQPLQFVWVVGAGIVVLLIMFWCRINWPYVKDSIRG